MRTPVVYSFGMKARHSNKVPRKTWLETNEYFLPSLFMDKARMGLETRPTRLFKHSSELCCRQGLQHLGIEHNN